MEGIEDIYPLTPAQAGMVFHALAHPADGVYTGQVCFHLLGQVSAEIMRETWNRVVMRHAVLRTGILWEDLEEPLQVVHQEVEVPWQEHDWSGFSASEQSARFEQWKMADREAGFELGHPPLMRLAFFDLGAGNYWLVWTSHHAIADGWSIGSLLNDMATIYVAIECRKVVDLPPAFPFNRFISWIQSRDAESADAYWRSRLAGFDQPLNFLTPRPTEFLSDSDTHETLEVSLDRELSDTIAESCRTRRISFFTMVQAAWGLLLSRYCDRDDVVFGVTSAGRPPELAGVESAVGMFLNTLPVRHSLDPEQAVSEWLQNLHADAREFLIHEATSLPRVKELSDISDGSPLFDTILVMTNYPKAYSPGDGQLEWSVEQVDVVDHSNYALALVITPGSNIELKLVYDGNTFSHFNARQILVDLEGLLGTLAREPQRKLGEIELLAGSDRESVLQDWSQGGDLGPELELGEETVLDDWRRRVQEQPDHPALTFEGLKLSRRELDQCAEEMAKRLRAAGIHPGDRVAICLDPGPGIIESILGVLKAGAAYVPIDPSLPSRRVKQMLEDSGSRLLITSSEQEVSLQESGAPLLFIDREHVVAASGAPDRKDAGLAYVLFTSGSTGHPKGVAVTHANLSASNRARRAYYPSQPRSFLLLSAFFFDSSVAGIFWTLTSGGVLVIARRRIEQDMEHLAAIIEENGISHTLCLPGLYRAILEHVPPDTLASLDTVILAGEVLPPEVIRHHRVSLPAVRLYNEYGPTEATVWCTVFDTAEWGGEGSVPIGNPIPGSSVYILDSNWRHSPLGVAGEICVAGPGVAAGYLGLPEANEASFTAIKLSGERQRIYRTGDAGRFLPDGTIEYIGRQDEQVKIRGHRIELAEIEAALLKLPMLDHAVVLVLENPNRAGRGRHLVAFVVAKGTGHDEARWKTWLREHLPEHMVPQRIIVLDDFPRLSNGKVDREALRTLPDDRPVTDDRPTAKLDPQCLKSMQEIWADVLQVAVVTPADNFFDLGGDSLLSINVVARAKKQGIELRPSHLFDFPTLSELLQHLEEERSLRDRGNAGVATLRSRNVSGSRKPFFMVHGGRRILSELRTVLGKDQPLHLQPAHWDSGDIDADMTLEQMAEEALASLLEVQADGPYLIGGYSFGAVIAIEMARQLEQAGKRVAMLFMLDPPELPGIYRSLPAPVKATKSTPLSSRLKYYQQRLPDNVNYWVARACRAMQLGETERLKAARRRMHVAKTYLKASEAYDLPTLESPVIVFRATGGYHKADASIWRGVARGELTIEEFDCDHEDLQWDAATVTHWAGLFKNYLDQAEES